MPNQKGSLKGDKKKEKGEHKTVSSGAATSEKVGHSKGSHLKPQSKMSPKKGKPVVAKGKASLAKSSSASPSAKITSKSAPAHTEKSRKVKNMNTATSEESIPVSSYSKSSSPSSRRPIGSYKVGRGSLDLSPETVCREVACEGLATSGGYCRLHYIKNWKKIKRKETILKERRLNQYIEELVAKYPDKYIEAIRQDLANDKDFAKVIYDLDLDEGVDDFDAEGGESVDPLIDNIKRDFDDESDGF